MPLKEPNVSNLFPRHIDDFTGRIAEILMPCFPSILNYGVVKRKYNISKARKQLYKWRSFAAVSRYNVGG